MKGEVKKILSTTIKIYEIAATLNVKGIRMDFGGETCVKVEKPWQNMNTIIRILLTIILIMVTNRIY